MLKIKKIYLRKKEEEEEKEKSFINLSNSTNSDSHSKIGWGLEVLHSLLLETGRSG
jgi:hypothetical protein